MENAVLVAKMSLNTVAKTFNQGEAAATGETISLSAVYSDSESATNKQWSKWTPSGSLTLSISNPDAVGKVTAGYYKVYLVPCGKDD